MAANMQSIHEQTNDERVVSILSDSSFNHEQSRHRARLSKDLPRPLMDSKTTCERSSPAQTDRHHLTRMQLSDDHKGTDSQKKTQVKGQKALRLADRFFQNGRSRRSKHEASKYTPTSNRPSLDDQVEYHLARLAQQYANTTQTSIIPDDLGSEPHSLRKCALSRFLISPNPPHTRPLHTNRRQREYPKTRYVPPLVPQAQNGLVSAYNPKYSEGDQYDQVESQNLSLASHKHDLAPISLFENCPGECSSDTSIDPDNTRLAQMHNPIPPLLGRQGSSKQWSKGRRQSINDTGHSHSKISLPKSNKIKPTSSCYRQPFVSCSSYATSEASISALQSIIDMIENEHREKSSSLPPLAPSLIPPTSLPGLQASAALCNQSNPKSQVVQISTSHSIGASLKRSPTQHIQKIAATSRCNGIDDKIVTASERRACKYSVAQGQLEPINASTDKTSELAKRRAQLFDLKARIQASNRPQDRRRLSNQSQELCMSYDSPCFISQRDSPVRNEQLQDCQGDNQDDTVFSSLIKTEPSTRQKDQYNTEIIDAVSVSSDSSSEDEDTDHDDLGAAEEKKKAHTESPIGVRLTNNHAAERLLEGYDAKRPLSPEGGTSETSRRPTKVARISDVEFHQAEEHDQRAENSAESCSPRKRRLGGLLPTFKQLPRLLETPITQASSHSRCTLSDSTSTSKRIHELRRQSQVGKPSNSILQNERKGRDEVRQESEVRVTDELTKGEATRSARPPKSRIFTAERDAIRSKPSTNKYKDGSAAAKTPSRDTKTRGLKQSSVIRGFKREAKRKAAERPRPICAEGSRQPKANERNSRGRVLDKLPKMPFLGSDDEDGLFVQSTEFNSGASSIGGPGKSHDTGVETAAPDMEFDDLFEELAAPSTALPTSSRNDGARSNQRTTKSPTSDTISANVSTNLADKNGFLNEIMSSLGPNQESSTGTTQTGSVHRPSMTPISSEFAKKNTRKPISLGRKYDKDIRRKPVLISKENDESCRRPNVLSKKHEDDPGKLISSSKTHDRDYTTSRQPIHKMATEALAMPETPIRPVIASRIPAAATSQATNAPWNVYSTLQMSDHHGEPATELQVDPSGDLQGHSDMSRKSSTNTLTENINPIDEASLANLPSELQLIPQEKSVAWAKATEAGTIGQMAPIELLNPFYRGQTPELAKPLVKATFPTSLNTRAVHSRRQSESSEGTRSNGNIEAPSNDFTAAKVSRHNSQSQTEPGNISVSETSRIKSGRSRSQKHEVLNQADQSSWIKEKISADCGDYSLSPSRRSSHGGKQLNDESIQAYYASLEQNREQSDIEIETEAEDQARWRYRDPTPIKQEDALHWRYRVERRQWKLNEDESEALWYSVGDPVYYSVEAANSVANYEVIRDRFGLCLDHNSEHQGTLEHGMKQWMVKNELGCVQVRVVRNLRDRRCGELPESKKWWIPKRSWIVKRIRYKLRLEDTSKASPEDLEPNQDAKDGEADEIDDLFDESDSSQDAKKRAEEAQIVKATNASDPPNEETEKDSVTEPDGNAKKNQVETQGRTRSSRPKESKSPNNSDEIADIQEEHIEIPGTLHVDVEGGTWSLLEDANQRAKNILLDECYDPKSNRIDDVNGRFKMQKELEQRCKEMDKSEASFDVEIFGWEDGSTLRVWVEAIKANGPWN